ncbi:hypothetical protein FEM48_Zijuj01G0048400 [Ziziphus jujuba var. spinosa]|uniref:Phosphate transporter n=1 Tax=Ziziphus jujuba var. spinosa TaxID=714518 RepID=A0A978VZ79_ZIZJJ|nr:hypothetical protein FEM48_Zijuj01G0048400 [Ziziphus jujuba var. spinosa]
MSMKNDLVSIELAIKTVGKWKETYQWIPILGAIAAIATAFSTGANNLPAPFSSPVGSGALTLLKASLMACAIYVPGAAFASNSSVNDLFSDFLQEHQPNEAFLMWSFVIVLTTTAIWLSLATCLELPVSSQQSIQGALLGTILVTEGFSFIPLWNKNNNHNFSVGGLLWIFLEWIVAPLLACFCAFLMFSALKAFLLRHENAKKRILVFLPIDYGVSAGLLCLFVMYQIIPNITTVYGWEVIVAVVGATLIGAALSLVLVVPLAIKKFDTIQKSKTKKKNTSLRHQSVDIRDQAHNTNTDTDAEVEDALKDFMQMRVLETVYEEDEQSWGSPNQIQDSELAQPVSLSITDQSASFKQLLESTPNHLVQTKNFQETRKTTPTENVSELFRYFAKSSFDPVTEYDRQTLVRHALAEKYDEMEELFSYPQLLASCIFALIQSASEIAAVVTPYGAIHEVFSHRAKYSGNGEDMESVNVAWWFRAIGGFGAALGYFLCGWRLTQCLGGKLTYMSNSRGLASQLSTVAAMILVNRIKLPVSSVHAFVGSLVGVGMADDPRNVNWKLLLKFICGWVVTIIFCCGVAYVVFSASIHSPSYVVP